MAYTINANAKNVWIRDNEDTRDLSIQTDASSVYLDNGRTLEHELGEGSMVSNVATVDSAMSKVIDGTYDGAYESCVFKGRSLVNAIKNYSRSGYGSLSDNIALLDSGWIRATATSSNNHFELKMDNLNIKPSTKYMYILECRSNTFSGNGQTFQFGDTYKSHVDTPWTAPHIVRELPLGRYTFILTTKSDFSTLNNPVGDRSYICVGNGQIEFRYMILEYQEGMENWNIPFFEGICDVKMPILRNVGKNLLDINTLPIKVGKNICQIANGVVYSKPTVTYDPVRWIIPVEPNTTYTVSAVGSADVVLQFSNFFNTSDPSFDARISYRGNERRAVTFTTTTHTSITMSLFSALVKDLSIRNIQLEKEGAATTYEDYKTNILTTPEEIVLRSLPNGVQDTYNLLTGEYVKRIGEVVLDGSEGWSLSDNLSEVRKCYVTALTNVKVAESNSVTTINNRMSSITYNLAIKDKQLGIFARTSTNGLAIVIDIEKLIEFKTYLQQNPITVQYELATPITTTVKSSGIPFAYENGHVILESGSEEQSLLPTLKYSTVVNRTGQVESVTKTIVKQETQITELEKMLVQGIIGMDYNNTLLTLNLEIDEVI